VNASVRRSIAGAVLLVLGLIALRDFVRLGEGLPWRTMDELPDFYCAGAALDLRADPYRYEPLHTCEHHVAPASSFRGRLFAAQPALAVPAPQPAYDFPPFMALARLPFAWARWIDGIAIVASVVVCAAALAALGVPLEAAAASLALSTAFVELNTAQIVPFALLALVLGGVALAKGKEALAGTLAALVAIEPTAGLPVVLACLLWVPRARVAAALTLVCLVAIAVAVAGPAVAAEYVVRVLPAHAASEVRFPFQYSFTYLAAFLGMEPGAARALGAFSYLAATALGVAVAPRLAGALQRRELVFFFPALCAVTGGAFLHAEELCFALPALLILAVCSRGGLRIVAAFALCLLSVPWIAVWGEKQLFAASVVLCAVILWRLQVRFAIAAPLLCVVAAAIWAFELHPPRLPIPSPGALQAYAAGDLVTKEWADYTALRGTADPLWLAIKLPAWAALLAGVAISLRCSLRSPPASESSRENSRENRSPARASPRARTG